MTTPNAPFGGFGGQQATQDPNQAQQNNQQDSQQGGFGGFGGQQGNQPPQNFNQGGQPQQGNQNAQQGSGFQSNFNQGSDQQGGQQQKPTTTDFSAPTKQGFGAVGASDKLSLGDLIVPSKGHDYSPGTPQEGAIIVLRPKGLVNGFKTEHGVKNEVVKSDIFVCSAPQNSPGAQRVGTLVTEQLLFNGFVRQEAKNAGENGVKWLPGKLVWRDEKSRGNHPMILEPLTDQEVHIAGLMLVATGNETPEFFGFTTPEAQNELNQMREHLGLATA